MVTSTSPSESKTRERESPRRSPVATPTRSSRSSVPLHSAPRGRASFSAPPGRARAAATPASLMWSSPPPPERGVVALHDAAGVVPEVAQQAEVEAPPLRTAARRERLMGRREPLRRAGHRGATELAGALQHLRAAAQRGQPKEGLALGGADRQL